MQDDTAEQTEQPKPMSFSELMMLMLKFNDRLDTLWQRVLYSHAALVGVMAFFSRSPEAFLLPRVLVFFVYSANVVITYASILETYRGYKSAVQDLTNLKNVDATSNVQAWVRSHKIRAQPRRFGLVFLFIWIGVGYLLLNPFVWGR